MFALDAAAARIGSLVPGLALTCILLEFADQELELIDVVIKLLRRPAKARPLELGELHLQLLDVQRLGVYLSGVGRELAVLAANSARRFSAKSRSASRSVGRGSLTKDMA